jgi:hypothetical protein
MGEALYKLTRYVLRANQWPVGAFGPASLVRIFSAKLPVGWYRALLRVSNTDGSPFAFGETYAFVLRCTVGSSVHWFKWSQSGAAYAAIIADPGMAQPVDFFSGGGGIELYFGRTPATLTTLPRDFNFDCDFAPLGGAARECRLSNHCGSATFAANQATPAQFNLFGANLQPRARRLRLFVLPNAPTFGTVDLWGELFGYATYVRLAHPFLTGNNRSPFAGVVGADTFALEITPGIFASCAVTLNFAGAPPGNPGSPWPVGFQLFEEIDAP